MKKYVFIKQSQLTKEQVAASLTKFEALTPFGAYYILPIDASNLSKEFSDYVIFNEDDAVNASSTLAAGGDVETKIECINSLSPWAKKHDGSGNTYFKRHGSFTDDSESPFEEVPANSSKIIQIEVGFGHAKIEAMEVLGAGKNHSCNLLILDSDAGTYTGIPNYQLNQFAYNSCIAENFYRFSSKYDADLYYGMIVEIEIFNRSGEASLVGLNVELNEVNHGSL